MTPEQAIKRQCLSRWLEKLIADGPEQHPALGTRLERVRHENRIQRAKDQLDAIEGPDDE